jgi:hypothetical protein
MRCVAVLVGAYVCLIGAVVHRHVVVAGQFTIPWGLALVVFTTTACALAAERAARTGAACFALGWALVLLVLQLLADQGYLVASDTLGYAFSALCLGGIVMAMIRRPRVK